MGPRTGSGNSVVCFQVYISTLPDLRRSAPQCMCPGPSTYSREVLPVTLRHYTGRDRCSRNMPVMQRISFGTEPVPYILPASVVQILHRRTGRHSFLLVRFPSGMMAVKEFESRGRGLVAAAPIQAGVVVLEDSPCLLWTTLPGAATSCATCLRNLAGPAV